ncbi:hypothetical protein GBAR_LOCUS17277 [Geodia barretti]|uniref:Uncharacterized protein n=1 Tax=Geodia barretti TaxID=519541 RepID=A0AA35SIY7_GEOBA|nr:hypothetical protein GBAR_LOCUS17277 [Geodia barretti]
METWLLIVLGTLIVVFIFIFGVLTHAGYFSDLRIRTSLPVSLPRRAAYLIHRGPYKEVCTPLERITAIGRHQKIFCVFYDDPEKVSSVGRHSFCKGVGVCIGQHFRLTFDDVYRCLRTSYVVLLVVFCRTRQIQQWRSL